MKIDEYMDKSIKTLVAKMDASEVTLPNWKAIETVTLAKIIVLNKRREVRWMIKK